MNITNIHHCLIKGKIIDVPFKQSCTKSLHYVCTMYMLTTTSYFATISTLNYCIIICAWVGGLIFGNKTIYIYPQQCTQKTLALIAMTICTILDLFAVSPSYVAFLTSLVRWLSTHHHRYCRMVYNVVTFTSQDRPFQRPMTTCSQDDDIHVLIFCRLHNSAARWPV